MIIEQTIEVPTNHQIILDVPIEVPPGKVKLTFTLVSGKKEPDCVQEISPNYRIPHEGVKEKLQNLRGSLGKDSFGNLDGVTYQNKVRSEWDD